MRRGTRWRIAVLALAATTVIGWRPLSAHVRAAALLDRFGHVAQGPTDDVGERAFTVEARGAADGPIAARLYTPRGASRGAIVLVPGVHHLGIAEPRLIRFARALAGSGVVVLTPEVHALTEYRIEGSSAEAIGAAAHALRAQSGAPVGVMGMSFAGGLALLAAADARFAGDIAFVVAVGAHDDLARVARFFATNAIARPDGAIVTLRAHEYGPLVLVYDRVEDFFPAPDLPAAREALRLWLWEERDAARTHLAELSPPSRAKMEALFADKIDTIAPELLAEIASHADAMRAASPHGRLASLRAPVFLLHGAGDSVIPATETLWLAEDVPGHLVRDVLVSPALVHVELGEPTLKEKWELVHFMADVLESAARR